MTLVTSNTTNLELAVQEDSSFWQDSARTISASETDPVGAWDDQSGNGNHLTQDTTADKPTLQNGYVLFDGITDHLSQTGVLGQTFTIYTVYKYVSTSAFERVWAFSHLTNDHPFAIQFNGASSRPFAVAARNDSDTAASGTTGKDISTDAYQVTSFTMDSTDIKLYVDRTEEAVKTHSGTYTFDTFSLAIEDRGASLIGPCNIEVKLLYIYSVAHNDTDRQAIEDELISAYISSTQDVTASTLEVTLTHSTSNAVLAPVASLLETTITLEDGVSLHKAIASLLETEITFNSGITLGEVLASTLSTGITLNAGVVSLSPIASLLETKLTFEDGVSLHKAIASLLETELTFSTGVPTLLTNAVLLVTEISPSTGIVSLSPIASTLVTNVTLSTGVALKKVVASTLVTKITFFNGALFVEIRAYDLQLTAIELHEILMTASLYHEVL